jgi:hypothetical protein
MDNRINEIRKKIRALRVSMLEAESIMHDQINRGEDCCFAAEEVLKMRVIMSLLVGERVLLGDREPILINRFYLPRRAETRKPARKPERKAERKPVRPMKRHLIPAESRVR